MTDDISLRLANLKDKAHLLEWRNDSATRYASHCSTEVTESEHIAWLNSVLNNPKSKLFISEYKGTPVGTARMDLVDGCWRLSWTISSNWRGKGIAKKMISLLATNTSDPISAEIKKENIASIRVAETAGMQLIKQSKNILYFYRAATVP